MGEILLKLHYTVKISLQKKLFIDTIQYGFDYPHASRTPQTVFYTFLGSWVISESQTLKNEIKQGQYYVKFIVILEIERMKSNYVPYAHYYNPLLI